MSAQASKWTAATIGRALAHQVFNRTHLVVVPNCSWPGSECDLLVVRRDLRLVDVEIKISRADLKADMDKTKWVHPWDWRDPTWPRSDVRRTQWPAQIWKHYYAVPEGIWKPELLDCIQPMSGVILIRDRDDGPLLRGERQAKPNPFATRIEHEDVIDIARLASLRMWDALQAKPIVPRSPPGARLEQLRRELESKHRREARELLDKISERDFLIADLEKRLQERACA